MYKAVAYSQNEPPVLIYRSGILMYSVSDKILLLPWKGGTRACEVSVRTGESTTVVDLRRWGRALEGSYTSTY